KDGGNTFSGVTFLSYTNGKWLSDNVNADLQKRGVTTGNNTTRIDNDQAAEGGPIIRNRLWFLGAAGYTQANQYIANTPPTLVAPDGSTFDTVNTNYVSNLLLRLTSQVTPRNKLAAMAMRTYKGKTNEMVSGQDPYYASDNRPNSEQNYSIGEAKWTSTVS